jgi:hypothetical protein
MDHNLCVDGCKRKRGACGKGFACPVYHYVLPPPNQHPSPPSNPIQSNSISRTELLSFRRQDDDAPGGAGPDVPLRVHFHPVVRPCTICINQPTVEVRDGERHKQRTAAIPSILHRVKTDNTDNAPMACPSRTASGPWPPAKGCGAPHWSDSGSSSRKNQLRNGRKE